MKYPKRCLLAVVLSLWAAPALCQTSDAATPQGHLSDYLNRFTAEYNESQKKGGIPVKFTGEYTAIPEELSRSLITAFPNHTFAVANMLYLHYTWYPGLHLVLVSDKDTGNVVSYAWDLWFSGVSNSFRELLSQYPAKSGIDALSKVKALSELLVLPTNGRTGKLENTSGLISSELYIRSDWPWRVLRVKLDGHFRFGRMAFINPKNGKEASTISLR